MAVQDVSPPITAEALERSVLNSGMKRISPAATSGSGKLAARDYAQRSLLSWSDTPGRLARSLLPSPHGDLSTYLESHALRPRLAEY